MTDHCEGDARTTVFFDGSCPLCTREIEFMRARDRDGRLNFEDVTGPGSVLPEGRTREEALARFHVRSSDGTVRDGADAFVHMWRELPALRPLAALARVPGVTWVLERLYRQFLKVRPSLQRMARRRSA